MLKKHDLPELLFNTLKALGNKGTIVDVCKFIWNNYENELKQSNELFYTWQYDIRWAATFLRKQKTMKSAAVSPFGLWELSSN